MITATGAATSGGNNYSDGGFHDGGGSNDNWQQQQETATGDSDGQKQLAIAATTTAKVATWQQRCQRSKGIESRNGGNGSDGRKRQRWQEGWQRQLDSNGDG